ncbi:MAG: alpha/beta hydrolase [Nitrospira sp.]
MRDGPRSKMGGYHRSLEALFALTLLAAMPMIAGCQTERVKTPSATHGQTAARTTNPRVDKDMAAVLKEWRALIPMPIVSLSAEEARVQPTPADAVMALVQERTPKLTLTPVRKAKDLQIPGPGGPLPIRIYTPLGSGPFPVIVYYHGGGWVIGTIDTNDASARALANASSAIVVAVEYRKAPEHKFPAAHEDAYSSYQWVLRNAETFEGDPSMIAVAGESAGGNLAAAVCLMARARGEVLPVHQALIYPVAGYDFNTPSYQEHAHAQPLDKPMMAWFFDKYLKNPEEGNDSLIDLVNAPNLSGLPSATIITAEIDPLQSEGKRYADRLLEDGVPVMYRNFEGVTHEFFGMGEVVADAKQAVRLVAEGMAGSFDDSLFRRGHDKLKPAIPIEPLQD